MDFGVATFRHLVRAEQDQSTRRSNATQRAWRNSRHMSTVGRAPKSDGLKPFIQPDMPLQPDGDRKQQLRFAAERKGRACPRYVCADEETFVCVDQPSRHNDVSWMDSASAIKASPTVVHSVFVNAGSLSMRLFCLGQIAPLLSSETHSYTSLCLNPRVHYAVGSATLVRRRAMELCAGQ